MRSTWQLGKWRGIPIMVHWTVFLGLPWFYYQTRSLLETTVSFAALFFLLTAHELGHAVVAVWRKLQVRKIELFFIHGLCTHDQPYYEEDDVLIAWGGVAMQFVVLVIASIAGILLAINALPSYELLSLPLPVITDMLLAIFALPSYELMSSLLHVLIETNFTIIILNLIPVKPLDGAKAWRILPMLWGWIQQMPWAMSIRKQWDARERVRDRELEAKSERIAADIIDKLRKGNTDL